MMMVKCGGGVRVSGGVDGDYCTDDGDEDNSNNVDATLRRIYSTIIFCYRVV